MDLLGWHKEKIIQLVGHVIRYEHSYYCKIHGVDRALMFPDEVMNHIHCLLKTKSEIAFVIVEAEKQKLEAIKKHPEVLGNIQSGILP